MTISLRYINTNYGQLGWGRKALEESPRAALATLKDNRETVARRIGSSHIHS
jgi:hypothetical protein